MPYKRGNGTIEVELANVQSVLEVLDPEVTAQAVRIDTLESNRDWVRGALWVIIGLNGFILTVLLLLASWVLNHMTIKANFDNPGVISSQQNAGAEFSKRN